MDDEPSESPTEPGSPAAHSPETPEPPQPPPVVPPASTAPTASTPPPASTAPPPPAAAPPPQSPRAQAPAPQATDRRHQPPPLPQLITELRDLVVTYVKQQTLSPLKQLGRYVGFGLLGSLLLGFGVVFLGIGGLRLLQTETGDTFTGDWSWVPYLIMVFVLALGAALVWILRAATRAEQEAR